MANNTFVPSHPGVVADAERIVRKYIASLRGALADRRIYRRTLAELEALSMRQREDIGIAGYDLADIARAATRRS